MTSPRGREVAFRMGKIEQFMASTRHEKWSAAQNVPGKHKGQLAKYIV